MKRSELAAFYQSKANNFNAALEKIKEKIRVVSNLRVIVAIGFIAALYFGLTYQDLLYALPVLLLIFVVLVRNHGRMFDTKTHLENLISIQKNELAALEENFHSFPKGEEFIDPHHPYTHDLDVFGDGSLFQFINRSSTRSGRELLAKRLSAPPDHIQSILQQQEAARELATKTDFRHEIQAAGMEVEELPGDRQQLRRWLSHRPFLYGKKIYKIILYIFPAITLILLALSFFVDGVSPFFWLCAILQWGFLAFHLKKVSAFHQDISNKKNILAKYARMLKSIEQGTFTSSLMQAIHSRSKNANAKVSALASLAGAFDARLNAMTNLFVNSLLMYDLQCVYRLEKWIDEHATSLDAWFDTIHETEVLCSLGTFSFNHEEFTYPQLNTERRLEAIALGHPLIIDHERVVNDVVLDKDKSVLIITGANMAGKSTFLRTLGVNVVLALAGAPVCARKLDCPLIAIRSGMRTADSLRDHQSYFYAELNRLKSIVDELKTGKELLIMLDEILKGTNSTDKLAGSVELVRQLVAHPSLVLVATHDLALGNLEKEYPQRIRNYCFEPDITNDQLSFDYKLKPGLATKMNATFLMKKMGIIPR